MSLFLNECYTQMNQGEVIVAYKGCINADIISNTLNLIESKLDESVPNTPIRKKLYNVLVESLQNLFHHVDIPPDLDIECDSNFGVFILSKVDNSFRIATGNFIKNSKAPILKEKIDKINSLSKEELKDFYKFVLNNQTFSEKGGGGLGLIDIARKTGNKLDYTFYDYSPEYSFFNMNVLINE
ncbi:MAG TPA: SiaB family protein kinase [Tenuifilaceae bacterium]|nr:SiaB family protein kinase [Tenuifilaceae bacterium]HQB76887.1 SiaB family protein kinase [Tenuifilaceae bacterium]